MLKVIDRPILTVGNLYKLLPGNNHKTRIFLEKDYKTIIEMKNPCIFIYLGINCLPETYYEILCYEVFVENKILYLQPAKLDMYYDCIELK